MNLGPDPALPLEVRTFNNLIGFPLIDVLVTQYRTKLPNITNDVDVLKVKTSLTSDTIDGGNASDVVTVISTSSFSTSFPWEFEPRHLLWNVMNSTKITDMRVRITDPLNRVVDFNGGTYSY